MGCHFYRAESRGSYWDSKGNHIEIVCYPILDSGQSSQQMTINSSSYMQLIYENLNANIFKNCYTRTAAFFLFSFFFLSFIFHIYFFLKSLLDDLLGPIWTSFCTNTRNTRSPWDHLQGDSNRGLPNHPKRINCMDWFWP